MLTRTDNNADDRGGTNGRAFLFLCDATEEGMARKRGDRGKPENDDEEGGQGQIECVGHGSESEGRVRVSRDVRLL